MQNITVHKTTLSEKEEQQIKAYVADTSINSILTNKVASMNSKNNHPLRTA